MPEVVIPEVVNPSCPRIFMIFLVAGGSHWRTKLEDLGIMVTDAKSLFDRLQKTGLSDVKSCSICW